MVLQGCTFNLWSAQKSFHESTSNRSLVKQLLPQTQFTKCSTVETKIKQNLINKWKMEVYSVKDTELFPKVYRRHSKSLQLKRLRSLKNIKSRRRLVISSPADILCRSLWRERLRQSRLYLEWWRQAYRWEQPAGEKTGEGGGGDCCGFTNSTFIFQKWRKTP